MTGPDELLDEATLSALMRATWPTGGGCAEGAALLDRLLASPGEVPRAAIDAHLAACPTCGAAPEHAHALLASDEELAARRAELDRIAARLDARLDGALRPISARVIPLRPPRPRVWLLGAGSALALAAALVLAIGPEPTLPALPEARLDGAERGATLTPIGPVDDITAPPATLRWSPWHEPGVTYTVRLTRADGVAVWSTQAVGASAPLPPDVQAALLPATAYLWTVEATKDGAVVATTGPVPFRLAP